MYRDGEDRDDGVDVPAAVRGELFDDEADLVGQVRLEVLVPRGQGEVVEQLQTGRQACACRQNMRMQTGRHAYADRQACVRTEPSD